MNYKKLFGWAILIYAVVFLIISALIAYAVDTDSLIVRIITIVVVAVLAYLGGRNLQASSIKEVLKYSVGWVVIMAILDLVLTVPFTGMEIYSHWDVWVGYALILLVPLLTVKKDQINKVQM